MHWTKRIYVRWCRFADEKLENSATYVLVAALACITIAVAWGLSQMN